jgi:hypothetical protein
MHKEPSIISGTGAAIWSKLIFGLEVVSSRVYAPFLGLLPCFKWILEAVFCEGIQYRLRFCLDHLSCVKMTVSLFHLQLKNRKVVCLGDDSHVFGEKKFIGEKRSVRKCVVEIQQPVNLSSKFRGEVFAYFHAVAVKRNSNMRNCNFRDLGTSCR